LLFQPTIAATVCQGRFKAVNVFTTSKKEQKTAGNLNCFAFFAILLLFFTSNSVVFVDGREAQKYFLPQGAGCLSYITYGVVTW